MKRPIITALLGLFFVTFSPASESLETQIKAFQQTVTATLAKTPSTTPGDRRGDSVAYAVAGLSQLSANPANSNPQELDRMVASIVALTQNDPAVAKAAESLLAAAKSERQARIDRARADVDALLVQAGEACLAAKTPADLDAMLATLAPYGRNGGYERRIDDQESWQRAANAYRFVTRWQDYLAFLNQRNTNEATGVLRDLSSSVDVAIMPRSKIIELLAPPSSATTEKGKPSNDAYSAIIPKLEQAKTLEDMIAVARLANALPRENAYTANTLSQVLANLIEDRQQILAGSPPLNLFDNTGNGRQLSSENPASTPGTQAALLSFKRETQFAGIRLALAQIPLPPANAGETVDAYLIRSTEKAVAENNWMQVREILELYRNSSPTARSSTWVSGDISACTAYLAARNLDLAEQYSAAIAGYRRALQNTGHYVPVQTIGARLAELKKTHPEAFTESAASDQPDANSIPRNYQPPVNYPPGYNPSMPRANMRPAAPTGPAPSATTP